MNHWGNQWGWPNNSTLGYVGWTSGSSNVSIYPSQITVTPPLPGVMESPAAEFGDREWLDEQIAEVCALAA